MADAKWKVYKGVIKTIGVATVYKGKITETSVLEIGDELVEKVAYGHYVETYLGKAIKSGTPVAIGLAMNMHGDLRASYFREIIAIKMDGKIHQPEGGVMDKSALSLVMKNLKSDGGVGCLMVFVTAGAYFMLLWLLMWWQAVVYGGIEKNLIAELERTEV